MVRRYGDDRASAESIPFDEGGWVKRLSNRLKHRLRAYMVNDPSSKPRTTLSASSSLSFESMAIDTGSCRLSVAVALRGVVASSSRPSFTLHALKPLIESAANMVLFESVTSSGGSGGRSDTTISLTAHFPWDQLWRKRYCCFHFVLAPPLTRAPSSSHLDKREE
jgi:hypothetical protein